MTDQLAGGLGIGLVRLDADGRVRSWPRTVARLLGIGEDEVLGQPLAQVLRSAAKEAGASERLERALAGDRSAGNELPLRRPDGHDAVVHLVARDTGDGTLVALRDLTERAETQRFLSELHNRLSDLEALGRVGLWHWDRASGELQWSPQLFEIHGIDPLRFDGTLAAHVRGVREDRRDDVWRGLVNAASEGTGFEAEYPVVTEEGRERWLHLRADPVVGPEGEVEGLRGIVQDVTETREALRTAEAARADLERFAWTVAHDIKEPLTSIQGFAQLLSDDADLEPPFSTYAQRVEVNARRASELITQILQQARSTGPRTGAEVALGDVVAWVEATMRARLQRTGSRLVAGELPAVVGSEVLLRQILLNLVGNAVKYRHAAQPVTVTIDATVDDRGTCTWIIEDDGPGIPAGEQRRVFDDGYRARRDIDRGIEGTGIGLATVWLAVERHGGTVRIEDVHPHGARFVLTLPADPAIATPPGAPAVPVHGPAGGPGRARDDEESGAPGPESQARILELTDDVVQSLTTALWTLEVSTPEAAALALRQTLATARTVMTDLLDLGAGPVEEGSLRRIHAPPAMHLSLPPARPPPGRAADRLRVVVADDVEDIRELLRLRLESSGPMTVVAEAADGAQAIAQVAAHRPDAILLDLSMPLLDGIEVARVLRHTHPDLRIVVLSGQDEATFGPWSREAGADAYVPKDAPFDDVLDALRGNSDLSTP
ncbi:MAG TPA: ATP-binding protein [Nitriliruptorales bacterium]